ncbi:MULTISPECIES: hypothetical protein [Gluconobacter]|uniref:hypothetical protein n=1 Tax=Gluconobacter TaxID=441 RepID=UPI001B8D5B18|nr:hypothetical protein [Gluconobacter albidus]MBS1031751.1 hypothetical protein [Gluconobacter cerinus]MBS1053527.1 hypothetical protein [Gluconobacter kondonii]MBS1044305.1 hypothetical protein [Gluconobacter cerinus]MBS1056908.1 hypothetical protein [Gluconobacter kondonii]
MSQEHAFSLPQPKPDEAGFQLLVLQSLGQIGEMVAQIHQLVSPPDTPQEGEGLAEIMSRIASALDRQGDILDTMSEQLDRLGRERKATDIGE